jgi:hypothetical protein
MNFLTKSTKQRTPEAAAKPNTSGIFGLRYLEEEATDIYDVVGCLRIVDPVEPGGSNYQSGCDVDYD